MDGEEYQPKRLLRVPVSNVKYSGLKWIEANVARVGPARTQLHLAQSPDVLHPVDTCKQLFNQDLTCGRLLDAA
jgi:hypothetical protein